VRQIGDSVEISAARARFPIGLLNANFWQLSVIVLPPAQSRFSRWRQLWAG
jgi:hypothetical protein